MRCSGTAEPLSRWALIAVGRKRRDRLLARSRQCARGRPVTRRRRAGQQKPRPHLVSHAAARQPPRGLRTDQDLPRGRRSLQRDHRARGRAPDQHLAVRPADNEHRVRPAVHADRHPQDDVGVPGANPAHVAQGPSHGRRRTACACRVLLVALLVVEQQQHRVAAELQQRSAAPVRLGQQRREAGVDHVDELLGPLLAPAREPLGQPSESRDVGEHHRARDRLGEVVDRPGQTSEQRPGQERSQRCGPHGGNLPNAWPGPRGCILLSSDRPKQYRRRRPGARSGRSICTSSARTSRVWRYRLSPAGEPPGRPALVPRADRAV